MKLNYEEAANKPGIYKIFNTHTNRIYIGQAQCFKKRWKGHSSSLRNNKHQNKFLQNDFNKCLQELGNDDFLVFEVLEIMEGSTKEERNKREEALIKENWGEQCYNLRKNVKVICWSKNPEETQKKKSGQVPWNKGKKNVYSKETIKRMSEAHKGEKHSNYGKHLSEETKKKISQKNIEIGFMRGKCGEEHPFYGKHHTSEAREKMSVSHMGHIPWNKGKTGLLSQEALTRLSEAGKANIAISIKNIQEFNQKKLEEMPYKQPLISPDGIVYDKIKSLLEFGNEHDLDPSALYKLYKGKLKSVKGWKLYIEIA